MKVNRKKLIKIVILILKLDIKVKLLKKFYNSATKI